MNGTLSNTQNKLQMVGIIYLFIKITKEKKESVMFMRVLMVNFAWVLLTVNQQVSFNRILMYQKNFKVHNQK